MTHLNSIVLQMEVCQCRVPLNVICDGREYGIADPISGHRDSAYLQVGRWRVDRVTMSDRSKTLE